MIFSKSLYNWNNKIVKGQSFLSDWDWNTCLNFNRSQYSIGKDLFFFFITCKIWFQGCQQWQRWEKWDVPWRGSLVCRKVGKRWAWVHHWLRQPARQPCQARPWLWWMRDWARRGQAFPLVWATTFLVGSCLVCLDWSGHSILFTHLLLKRMRSQDCPSKPNSCGRECCRKSQEFGTSSVVVNLPSMFPMCTPTCFLIIHFLLFNFNNTPSLMLYWMTWKWVKKML